MTLAQREELFLILSSKLEKEDALDLEKKISVWILEKERKYYKDRNINLRGLINKMEGEYTRKASIENVAIEAKQNGLRIVIDANENRIQTCNEQMIEILK